MLVRTLAADTLFRPLAPDRPVFDDRILAP